MTPPRPLKPPIQRINGFPEGVGAAMSHRGRTPEEGASLPPYDFFNLGLHVGDSATSVLLNRTAFAAAIGATPVWFNQVHGTDTLELTEASLGRGFVNTGEAAHSPPQADACFSQMPGLACTMMVADCLPVLVCLSSTDSDQPIFKVPEGGDRTLVGAAHAGWRGLSAGVLESLLDALWSARQRHFPRSQPDGQADGPRALLTAWLGPAIGRDAFEVGPEVSTAFHAEEQAYFRPNSDQSKLLGDLRGIAEHRLKRWTHAHGVTLAWANQSGSGTDLGRDPDCTVSQPSQYFSHRRDRQTGRMAAAIWIKQGEGRG